MTGVAVLLALEGAPHESVLLTGISRSGSGVQVVRRCVDLADLLATATAGTATVAVVSAGLRRLDHEAVDRLTAAGMSVIGVVPAADESAERRLRMIGVPAVVAVADDDPAQAVSALVALVRDGARVPAQRAAAEPLTEPPDVWSANGRLVAVWGPTGAPGRTTVATSVACEAAQLGVDTLLADADTYGGAVAQLLGLLDESPGLAAAARAVSVGALDVEALRLAARQMGPRLRVLTGIVRADRWPELRASALAEVWIRARMLAALTVVDCGFNLEQDEELSYDTTAPRRNGATLTTLAAADVVLAVGRADPVGMQRLVRSLPDARAAAPQAELRVVLTRVRRGPVGRPAGSQLIDTLARHTGVTTAVLVKDDQDAYDQALATGRPLHEVAQRSPARLSLQSLAADLIRPLQPQRERGRRRRLRAAPG